MAEPAGYIGTPEAAQLLGVHQETVRNYVKDKKIEGMKEYDPGTKRERYWVKRESIEALMAEKAKTPERIETDDSMARRTQDVLNRIASQEENMGQRLLELHQNLNTRLNRVEDRQIQVAKNLQRAVDTLEEIGNRSKDFQDKVIGMVEEERKYLHKQRDELRREEEKEEKEEGGFWRWLFGSR